MTEGEPPVTLLMGPTASGKTDLALKLAEHWASQGRRAEIISVDSVQVYRGMDIGTAKPDALLRRAVPHHLINVRDPADSYSAANFRDDALALIRDIRARGAEPLLVGGTMLYFRALTAGLSDLPSTDVETRERIGREAARHGWPAMHASLAQDDPDTAARLHPNDRQRISRALEVLASSGTPLSTWQRADPPSPHLRFRKLALMPADRASLHARIAQRLHAMMQRGFVDEVARLRARGDLHPDLPSLRAVGYRQLWEHLEGRTSLIEAEQRVLAATRQFAKRQITWLRSEHDLCYIDADGPDPLRETLRWMQQTPC